MSLTQMDPKEKRRARNAKRRRRLREQRLLRRQEIKHLMELAADLRRVGKGPAATLRACKAAAEMSRAGKGRIRDSSYVYRDMKESRRLTPLEPKEEKRARELERVLIECGYAYADAVELYAIALKDEGPERDRCVKKYAGLLKNASVCLAKAAMDLQAVPIAYRP